MIYTWYQLLYFFFLYSLAGWWIGTSAAAVRERKFVDVGFLFGPVCPAYGFGALAFSIVLPELQDHLFFLFAGGVILSAATAFLTGMVLEQIFHRKWWDYSRKRFQFQGYVSLPYSLVWGLAAILCIRVLNPVFLLLLNLIPPAARNLILILASVVFILDFVGSCAAVLNLRIRMAKGKLVTGVSDSLQKTADYLGEGVSGRVLKRMTRAYPELAAEQLLRAHAAHTRRKAEKKTSAVFAEGCCFYKLTGLFFLGAFLGDITETLFCLATSGVLMSRSSVVYGPFSIVWGLGCAILTAVLHPYKDRSDHFIFLFGTILGGAYEYVCSLFTELAFGTVFWDYSAIPFNLGGRINLLYCFFWGIAAVVWLKVLYPLFSRWIEKIPRRAGIPGTWVLILFMIGNILISGMALARYVSRQSPPPSNGPDSAVETFLDRHFPDERMERIYPNLIVVEPHPDIR